MADIEKLMGVSAIDIEKVMGVAAADVEKVMGLGLVTTPAWAGTRAIVFAGGTSGNNGTDVIQYKAFGSGDMSDFGDVGNYYRYVKAVSNGSRGVAHLSYKSPNVKTNTLEYVTIGSTGNSSDFGDITIAVVNSGACTNGTTGFVAAGYSASGNLDVINYFTIGSTGNASDWGDLSAVANGSDGVNGSTRVLFNLGYSGVYSDTIDYWATASAGDASDFGDLDQDVGYNSTSESASRGVWFGGYGMTSGSSTWQDNIQYVTVASTGDASDFGNLEMPTYDTSAASNGTRAEVYGGYGNDGSAQRYRDTVQYVTIASTGNATDDGDLLAGNENSGACSGT
jgi:hypothetical protein